MKIYELHPIDGRASFYGKARVVIDENGVETLVSYNTPIMRRLLDGNWKSCGTAGRRPQADTLKHFAAWIRNSIRHFKRRCKSC